MVLASNADPRTTFLGSQLIQDLGSNFEDAQLSRAGYGCKDHPGSRRITRFWCVEQAEAENKLSGRIHVGPEIDYLERAFDAAKYGDYSAEPYLDITIPSLGDSSLAPEGKHVMSIHVQFAPYRLRQGDWKTRAGEFAASVVKLLTSYAPGLQDLIVGKQVITPLELEQTYRLSGGHIHHGEQALDQFFTFRPLINWAQYRTPLKRLYLCGAGTHPGGGITGISGMNAAREIVQRSEE